jgi:hypothetical protein
MERLFSALVWYDPKFCSDLRVQKNEQALQFLFGYRSRPDFQ